MKLIDLKPEWIDRPRVGRRGIGVSFRCPCSKKPEHRMLHFFANPLDGGPSVRDQAWSRTGDTFETLSLSPSLGDEPHGHWTLTNGELSGVTS